MGLLTIVFSSIGKVSYSRKVFILKNLKQITVIGLGLLGGSISLAVSRSFSGVKTVGYSHRQKTRRKAEELHIADLVVDDLEESVLGSDLVILATPIYCFEEIMSAIGDSLEADCIVTDVGSTKAMAHRWATKYLPSKIRYVGSHPIAGSEQRGVEYARDDLFDQSMCVLTGNSSTSPGAIKVLKSFWSKIGCRVKMMKPAEHDRIFAKISHLPHVTAAALINACTSRELDFCGKGFIDTSRIASGPASIWGDILLTNAKNCSRDIDKLVGELLKLKAAIETGDERKIRGLLETARKKREVMITQKLEKKELI